MLGVLRFDDLEPEYQKRAERIAEEGTVGFFESEATSVFGLRHKKSKAQRFLEMEITEEDVKEM